MKPKFIAVIGGALMILGSFLPWVTLSDFAESISFTGVQEGLTGPVTIVLGLVAALAALAARESPGANGSIPAAICGIFGAGAAIGQFIEISTAAMAFTLQGIQVSPGIGLILVLIGGIVAAVGGYRHNEGEAPVLETSPVPPTSWQQVWISTLTKPVVATYETIIKAPTATSGTAYRWVAIAYLIGAVVQVVGTLLLLGGRPASGIFAGAGVALICLLILAPLLAVVGLAIGAGITNWLARLLGGVGSYAQLAYAFASYSAPLGLLTFALGTLPIPIVVTLTYGLAAYNVVLEVVAIKGVHQLSWGRSILAAFGILVLIIIVAVAVIVILAILGPTIGDIFSNIVSNV